MTRLEFKSEPQFDMFDNEVRLCAQNIGAIVNPIKTTNVII